MPQSKDSALAIARQFVRKEYRDSKWPVLLETPLSIERAEGGFPTDYLGLGECYWSVMFQLEQEPGTVMTPDHVIVLVDDETGEPKWFPVM